MGKGDLSFPNLDYRGIKTAESGAMDWVAQSLRGPVWS